MPQVRVHIRLEGERGEMLGAESVMVDLPNSLAHDERADRQYELSALHSELYAREQKILHLERDISARRWEQLPWWRRLFGWLPS